MTIFFINERYRAGTGPLYPLDARVKLLGSLVFALAILAVPEGHWAALLGFGLYVVAVIAVSRQPVGLVFARSLLALPFLAMVVPLIFTRPGDPVGTLPIVGWTATSQGLVAVATIMFRAWLCVLMAVILTSVTRPLDLIRALERLHLPRVMSAIVLFMYRYLFLIGDEAHRLMRARDARSANPGDGWPSPGVLWRGRILGNMVGSLFIRSFERSERVYAAMQARGYDGTIRMAVERPLSRRDWTFLAAILLLLIGLAAYARL